MLAGEIYCGQDGLLFKIKRISENPEFLRFEIFSEEDLNSLTDFLTRKNKRSQKNARLDGADHKAAGARTDTGDGIYRGDYLH